MWEKECWYLPSSAIDHEESVICAIIGRDKCFVVRYKDRPVPLILFADYIFELARGIKSSHFTFQKLK